MKIVFENGEVEAYKLKKGTVLLYDDKLFHIRGFKYVKQYGLLLIIGNEQEAYSTVPDLCTWLEPN